MKEEKLPSGAVLQIGLSSFADSKALYQAVLEECRMVTISGLGKSEMANLYKDLVCIGFSSPKIEKALNECFKQCLYNNGTGALKIDKDTFEPAEARQDYMNVCLAVLKENINPFVKSLYAEFGHLIGQTENVPT